MKVGPPNLEQIRNLLGTASGELEAATKASKEAEESRVALEARVRSLQASFDLCAGAFAQDTDLNETQLNDLPAEAQQMFGYVKPVPAV